MNFVCIFLTANSAPLELPPSRAGRHRIGRLHLTQAPAAIRRKQPSHWLLLVSFDLGQLALLLAAAPSQRNSAKSCNPLFFFTFTQTSTFLPQTGSCFRFDGHLSDRFCALRNETARLGESRQVIAYSDCREKRMENDAIRRAF